MERRDFLKLTGISSLAGSIPFLSGEENPTLENLLPKEPAHKDKITYTALAETDVTGSKYFPVRPLGVTARHGDLVQFVAAYGQKAAANGNRSNERLYVIQVAPLQLGNGPEPDMIKYRVRVGKPEPPAFVFWHVPIADIYVYTAPGALVKRACAIMRTSRNLMAACDHVRFATLLNVAYGTERQVTEQCLIAEELFQIALRENSQEKASTALNAYFVALKLERS